MAAEVVFATEIVLNMTATCIQVWTKHDQPKTSETVQIELLLLYASWRNKNTFLSRKCLEKSLTSVRAYNS